MLNSWMFSFRAESFSCGLDVYYGGLRKSKLHFFIKIKLYIFLNFLSSNPEPDPEPEPVRVNIDLKGWIRVQIRIETNPNLRRRLTEKAKYNLTLLSH